MILEGVDQAIKPLFEMKTTDERHVSLFQGLSVSRGRLVNMRITIGPGYWI